jgi:hypothetical protein
MRTAILDVVFESASRSWAIRSCRRNCLSGFALPVEIVGLKDAMEKCEGTREQEAEYEWRNEEFELMIK